MTNEMWTHENENLDFRSGFRAGLEFAISTVEELLQELKNDGRHDIAAWVKVAEEWLEDEHSMYELETKDDHTNNLYLNCSILHRLLSFPFRN